MKLKRAFLLASCLVLLAAVSAFSRESYDISGRWIMKGTGWGEKSFVRLQLKLDGTLDIRSDSIGEQQYITGYDLHMRLDTSRVGVKTWEEHGQEKFSVPVPMPEVRPTVDNPFRLPIYEEDGLRYEVILTGIHSGKVRINGDIDLDVIGRTHVESESAIWKQGTKEPEREDLLSGCSAANWGLLGTALLTLVFLRRRG